MKTKDPRAGLPSASSMERVANCPGSENLIRTVPPTKLKEHDEWAASGDRVHAYLADPESDDKATALSEDEIKVAKMCQEHVALLAETVFPIDIDRGLHPMKVFIEQRLWGRINGVEAFSGQPDRYHIVGDTALVIDYKSMRGDTPDSASNLQLRTLAVLVAINHTQVERAFVAISQPLISAKPEICEYSKDNLIAAGDEIAGYLEAAKKPDAPRHAGHWCTFCPAKLQCAECKATATAVVAIRAEELKVMSPTDLGRLLSVCKIAEGIIKSAREQAKELIKQGVDVPGWSLEPGNSVRSIKAPKEAYKALHGVGALDLDGFMSVVKLPISDLEKAVRAKMGCTADAAKQLVNSQCCDYIEKKQNEPSLKQVK